jgi:hypothetical protein
MKNVDAYEKDKEHFDDANQRERDHLAENELQIVEGRNDYLLDGAILICFTMAREVIVRVITMSTITRTAGTMKLTLLSSGLNHARVWAVT